MPEAVRGKMEAALGADFSGVRVHVGTQAERIGAIAFTLGSDIYFAPGRFQPDTPHGQQLLGHELAHVVQQRQGRVRNPVGSGIAVVQDHALEAEADRLGRHAAAHRVAVQAKRAPGAAQPSAPVRISPPISAGPGSYRLTAGASGRQVGSVMVHAREKASVEVTDLGVDQSQRGHGIGQMLVASAARTGLQFGKSKVTLAAQDKGSGHLTRWYKQMGFTQTGVNQRGNPQLEAPISRVLAGTAQRKGSWSSGTLQAMDVSHAHGLRDLAVPQVSTLPAKETQLQDDLVDKLEEFVKEYHWEGFAVIYLCTIELPQDLTVGKIQLLAGMQLKETGGALGSGLPNRCKQLQEFDKSTFLKEGRKIGTGEYYSDRDFIYLCFSIKQNVLNTLTVTGQLDYLKYVSDDRWKILIDVHYYRDRAQNQLIFHKDTTGDTLFVNLNFITDTEIAGPEYILNPPAISGRDHSLEKTLPAKFRRDLRITRRNLPEPQEIRATRIPAKGIVSFVDELIHHTTPHLGRRTVSGEELGNFLREKYPNEYDVAESLLHNRAVDLTRTEVRQAYADMASDRRWRQWIRMSEANAIRYNRTQLENGRFGPRLIEEIFDKYYKGFGVVAVKHGMDSGVKYPIRASGGQAPKLERQMSRWAVKGKVPAPLQGKRRFFRVWVRAARRNVQ